MGPQGPLSTANQKGMKSGTEPLRSTTFFLTPLPLPPSTSHTPAACPTAGAAVAAVAAAAGRCSAPAGRLEFIWVGKVRFLVTEPIADRCSHAGRQTCRDSWWLYHCAIIGWWGCLTAFCSRQGGGQACSMYDLPAQRCDSPVFYSTRSWVYRKRSKPQSQAV